MAMDPSAMMGGAPPLGMGAPGGAPGGMPGAPPMDPAALMMALKALKGGKAAPRHHAKAKAKKAK